MKKENANDVRFESWHQLLDALKTDYTTSFKDVCRTLRASRTWVNNYIRPFVHSTYISNGRRGEHFAGVNWVRVAAITLGREEEMTDSIWFNTEEFQDYIRRSVVSVTKQTKSVPVTALMTAENAEAFVDKRSSLQDEIKAEKDLLKRIALMEDFETCFTKFVEQDPTTKELLRNRVSVTARKKADPVPADLPENYMEVWFAPHDIKGYGDADETIYRNLFREGAVRVELQLPDENGVPGKKVFYLPDPDPIEAPHPYAQRVCVRESAWREYQKKKA